MNEVITVDEAKKILKEYNKPYFFSVEFIKRTNGELRKMVCRKGVRKYVSGGELKFRPNEKDLLGVWDATIKDRERAYRFINMNGLVNIKLDGHKYVVGPNP